MLRFADRTVDAASVAASGSGANDRIDAGTTSRVIDGGTGIDTVVFAGTAASASVARSGAGFIVTQANGAVDTLVGIERLLFSDSGLALDTDGQSGQLYRLYEAVFARVPDADGMGFWLGHMEQGMALSSIAIGFQQSPEFIGVYGANPTPEFFVTQLYHNVLDREPDAAGFAYHVARLESGVSREQVLLGFSESPEFTAALAPTLPIGVPYLPWSG
jgi:hypothetical protein